MKSSFYYEEHHEQAAISIKDYLNSLENFLPPSIEQSTRAAGDAVESLISERFNTFLGDWCDEYSSDFSRRAMADLAFKDIEGVYSVVDIKTHRTSTSFNMPNITSVERLARFCETDTNVFALIIIEYSVDQGFFKFQMLFSHRLNSLIGSVWPRGRWVGDSCKSSIQITSSSFRGIPGKHGCCSCVMR